MNAICSVISAANFEAIFRELAPSNSISYTHLVEYQRFKMFHIQNHLEFDLAR